MHTICKHNIITAESLGTRIKGEKFPKGCERVLFPKRLKGEIIGYFAQI
jgi:hypothetical protein